MFACADDRHLFRIVTQPVRPSQRALDSSIGSLLLTCDYIFDEPAASFVPHIPQRFRRGKADFPLRIVQRGLERRKRLEGFHLAQLRCGRGANQGIGVLLHCPLHLPDGFRVQPDGSGGCHGLTSVQRVRVNKPRLQDIPGGLFRLRDQARQGNQQ